MVLYLYPELIGSPLIARPIHETQSQGILILNIHDGIAVEYGRVVGWGVYSDTEEVEIHVDVWRPHEGMYKYVINSRALLCALQCALL